MGKSERPEHTAPPDIYYNAEEARKYTTNSRIMQIQVRLGFDLGLAAIFVPPSKPIMQRFCERACYRHVCLLSCIATVFRKHSQSERLSCWHFLKTVFLNCCWTWVVGQDSVEKV